jgi:hypothetical protein
MPQSPREKKARMSKSKIKTMVIIFFRFSREFVPSCVTVNNGHKLDAVI